MNNYKSWWHVQTKITADWSERKLLVEQNINQIFNILFTQPFDSFFFIQMINEEIFKTREVNKSIRRKMSLFDRKHRSIIGYLFLTNETISAPISLCFSCILMNHCAKNKLYCNREIFSFLTIDIQTLTQIK
jgi:hypothetical protein